MRNLPTGLMPSMDEGAFVVDYWAPSGSPLAETERKARKIEEVLSKNPDVKAYVRRTGAELGLFATETSRGDIQVRPAEQDPTGSSTNQRVRPPLAGPGGLEEMLKAEGKTVADEKENIRKKYRRRTVKEVMEEVEDEIKDSFGEHQLKVEVIQDHGRRAERPVGGEQADRGEAGPLDQEQLRKLAAEVGEVLETKGEGPHRRGRYPRPRRTRDPMIRLDGVYADKLGMKPDAVARQLRVIFQGQIAAQVPESSQALTAVRVRYPDSVRFGTDPSEPGKGYFDRQRANEWILLPETNWPCRAGASGCRPTRCWPGRRGRCRCTPW